MSKMLKYIALLRGVNIGGRNKIIMAELKTAFERQGYLLVCADGNLLKDTLVKNIQGQDNV